MSSSKFLKIRFPNNANVFLDVCFRIDTIIKEILVTESYEAKKSRITTKTFHFFLRKELGDRHFPIVHFDSEDKHVKIKYKYKNRDNEELTQEYRLRLIQKGDLGCDKELSEKETEGILFTLKEVEKQAKFQLNEITDKPLRDKEDFKSCLDIMLGHKTDFKKHNTSIEALAKSALDMTFGERVSFEKGIGIFLTDREYNEYEDLLEEMETARV